MGYLSSALTGAYGVYQGIQARKGLKAYGKETRPNYEVTPEQQKSYARAEQMATGGYTAQEEGAFKQNLASQRTGTFRAATDSFGGNVGQALNSALQSQNIGALNQFSAQDAALHRQNIQYADQLGEQITGQKNLATGQNIQDYQMRGAALAALGQSAAGNVIGGVQGIEQTKQDKTQQLIDVAGLFMGGGGG